MKERQYFEDYTVGEKMVSPSRTITEADIVNFAMITGDWHPIHVNREYAEATVFGERIAHGMLTLTLGGSMCMWMGPNTFVPKSFIAFLGMEEVRLPSPTKIGDTLHWEGEVVALDAKSKGRGMITWSCRVVNQRNEVCASYIHRSLCGQRPLDGA